MRVVETSRISHTGGPLTMLDYTIAGTRLQEETVTDSTGKSAKVYVDTGTGELVESLKDGKYPWKERKQATLRLYDVYKAAGLDSEAWRAKACSTWLEYLASEDLQQRELHHFNACKLRLCPVCSTRKARITAIRLAKILEKVQNDHQDTQLIFLTLTVRNCTGGKLRETLDLLTRAWKKLIDRKPVQRAIKGWFRAIEITHNRVEDTYHPHIHAILVVEDAYFKRSSGLYITQDKWVGMWQQSLQVKYRPVLGIQSTYAKNAQGKQADRAQAAAVEAAKYAVKGSEYIDPAMPIDQAASVARTYTEALRRKRLTALGGWMLEASRELDLDVEADDADLVHGDEGSGKLDETTAMWLEDYKWYRVVAEYLLADRKQNPGYLG